MRFPLHFINWLLTLYKHSTASIKLGGCLSESFSPYRGTWQGCPLSPVLFTNAMEPVAEALRTSPEIWDLRVGWLEERVALYADDLLLFLQEPCPYLQGALRVLNISLEVTGLRINWTKSQNFLRESGVRPLFSPDILLQWVDSSTWV